MAENNKNIHQNLINRCADGDSHAQEELYRLYSKAMFNVCLRIINNHDDAEDVLQEAFISAFNNISSYKGTATFGAWLKRIVINKSLNFIKKSKLEVVPIDSYDHYEGDDQQTDDDKSLEVHQIKNALRKLPDGYRLVFSLYLLEGYDHSEIAEILGITESTSKSQFNRSKKKIREIIREEANYERSKYAG